MVLNERWSRKRGKIDMTCKDLASKMRQSANPIEWDMDRILIENGYGWIDGCLFLVRLSLPPYKRFAVHPKKYAHSLWFGVLLWFSDNFYPYSSGLLHWHWGNHMIAPGQSYDCPSASEGTLKHMGKYLMWINYEGWCNDDKTTMSEIRPIHQAPDL